MHSKAYKSYEISKNEYRELKYFCLRYSDLKKAGRNFDVQLIDRALELATDEEIIREYLRSSVTTEMKFENLDVPMGKRQFYVLRRKFFFILRGLKNGLT